MTADGQDTIDGDVIYASAEGHTFTIENTPGTALPSTGSTGTATYYFLGAAVMLLASALAAASEAGRRRRS